MVLASRKNYATPFVCFVPKVSFQLYAMYSLGGTIVFHMIYCISSRSLTIFAGP